MALYPGPAGPCSPAWNNVLHSVGNIVFVSPAGLYSAIDSWISPVPGGTVKSQSSASGPDKVPNPPALSSGAAVSYTHLTLPTILLV